MKLKLVLFECYVYTPDPQRAFLCFADAEDRIIVEAHAKYGNKWAIIAKILQGRTENAIKNHRNWTLRKRLVRPISMFPSGTQINTNVNYNSHLDTLTKASSEDTLSNGTSINQSLQLQDVTGMEVSNYHVFEDPSLKHQTLFRPTPHVGAFPVCSPPNGPDFVDYEELAPYSNQELATIAKYGNKWAIIAKLLRDQRKKPCIYTSQFATHRKHI
ncbi:transcription factor MYB1 [Tanacetum coccineum]